ncbi:zinc finger protein [Macleaya cordata]|uniref:Zinc finger protein n=1 Tax=Macleaya cordata TaxID=56857 RepID=A0A200Q912_MACCD|nr:zinc finger protein [Macleaya cordata]
MVLVFLASLSQLKDVLTWLDVANEGTEQDLMDRILALLSDEQVSKVGKEALVKMIDDTYRNMQNPGATVSASEGKTDSEINDMELKEEVGSSFQLDVGVRCPCGISLRIEPMIQCEDPRCLVLQHTGCVIIPVEPTEGAPPAPSQFYCEICRINRADLFWETLGYPFWPMKLTVSSDGKNPKQNVEKTFILTNPEIEYLEKLDCDIQAWCILLNDKDTFRMMHWPKFSDLNFYGASVRTSDKSFKQLLGANGHYDGPVVLKMITEASKGEPFEDALVRFCNCVGGGTADSEVVGNSVIVNLRCPMTGFRMKIAARFKPCVHIDCFDLESFVKLNEWSSMWQCPHCFGNYCSEQIIIDPYINRIITQMQDRRDENEIVVMPDGSWWATSEPDRLVKPADMQTLPSQNLLEEKFENPKVYGTSTESSSSESDQVEVGGLGYIAQVDVTSSESSSSESDQVEVGGLDYIAQVYGTSSESSSNEGDQVEAGGLDYIAQVYGTSSESSSSEGDQVEVGGLDYIAQVYGTSTSSSSEGNQVEVGGLDYIAQVYGTSSESSSNEGDQVEAGGLDYIAQVYGTSSESSSSEGDQVEVGGLDYIAQVYGTSTSSSSEGNQVEVGGLDYIAQVYGTSSESSSNEGDQVEAGGLDYIAQVYGTSSESSSSEGDQVEVGGLDYIAQVYGTSTSSSSEGNQVEVGGLDYIAQVYGTSSESSSV